MDNLSPEEIQLRAHQVTDEVNVLLGISNSLSVSQWKDERTFLDVHFGIPPVPVCPRMYLPQSAIAGPLVFQLTKS